MCVCICTHIFMYKYIYMYVYMYKYIALMNIQLSNTIIQSNNFDK